MKTIDRLKNYFICDEYFIGLYKNHIYIINYIDILDFNETTIKIKFKEFIILISGANFKITRKNNYEIELYGLINKLEIINE